MKWTEIEDMAIALANTHPDLNPMTVRFTALRKMVVSLPDFDDQPERCNEKILEAIQAAWVEEKE